jgi:hypothetical protein
MKRNTAVSSSNTMIKALIAQTPSWFQLGGPVAGSPGGSQASRLTIRFEI